MASRKKYTLDELGPGFETEVKDNFNLNDLDSNVNIGRIKNSDKEYLEYVRQGHALIHRMIREIPGKPFKGKWFDVVNVGTYYDHSDKKTFLNYAVVEVFNRRDNVDYSKVSKGDEAYATWLTATKDISKQRGNDVKGSLHVFVFKRKSVGLVDYIFKKDKFGYAEQYSNPSRYDSVVSLDLTDVRISRVSSYKAVSEHLVRSMDRYKKHLTGYVLGNYNSNASGLVSKLHRMVTTNYR